MKPTNDIQSAMEAKAAAEQARKMLDADVAIVIAYDRTDHAFSKMVTAGLKPSATPEQEAEDVSRVISNLLSAAQELLNDATDGQSCVILRDADGSETVPDHFSQHRAH